MLNLRIRVSLWSALPTKGVCFAAFAAMLLASPVAQAQGRGSSTTASFTPKTREVIEGLGKLRMLDATGWKIHPGDLPHGEDPSLDDSSWLVVDRRTTAPTGAAWCRRWFEMPKDLDGYDLSDTR